MIIGQAAYTCVPLLPSRIIDIICCSKLNQLTADLCHSSPNFDLKLDLSCILKDLELDLLRTSPAATSRIVKHC